VLREDRNDRLAPARQPQRPHGTLRSAALVALSEDSKARRQSGDLGVTLGADRQRRAQSLGENGVAKLCREHLDQRIHALAGTRPTVKMTDGQQPLFPARSRYTIDSYLGGIWLHLRFLKT
jgi:hypothetical protein